MSRVEQTETEINSHWCDGWEGKAKHIHHVARALAAEVDELRAKLDQVRSEVGCARGQRTTQFCAEAVEYKRRLDAIVALLEPGLSHATALERAIAKIRRVLHARAVAIAEGRDDG